MKSIIFLTVLAYMNVSLAAQTLTCKSNDFNPSNYDGQALKITLGVGNKLIEVEKVKGSWFSDSGFVSNPKPLAQNSKGTVYDVNFGNDEYNGRVIVPNTSKVTSIIYQFSYADDERNRQSTSVLICK